MCPLFRVLILALWTSVSGIAIAQSVSFTSSDLPIVVIDTDGQDIQDEPKIMARMGIIDNGPGVRNQVSDPFNDYDGWIGIEVRGSSSQMFPKKQYGVETRDAEGNDLDVSLLGFPEEEDWILHAPYSDKSLMRNVLAYELARETDRYASRTRYCEVVLNGQYQGVYILMEKIKRDDNRVDVNNLRDDEVSGDDLTGGYIVKVDKGGAEAYDWLSDYASAPYYPGDQTVRYQVDTPDGGDIVPEQEAYIRAFFDHFEDTMASDDFDDEATGYPALIDEGSFVDYLIVTELSYNIDGYRLSAYFHKDKDSNDPRLHAGPVWDYNLAFGNANYYGGQQTTGFQYDFREAGDSFQVPFWWPRLTESARFVNALRARWTELRAGPFATDALMARIDSVAALLDEAQTRNFERWPVLGDYVWPNPDGYEQRTTYASEVDYLKVWLRSRLNWLDSNLPQSSSTEPPLPDTGLALSPAVPNPSHTEARLRLTLTASQQVTVDVYDVRGRRVTRLLEGPLGAGEHPVVFDASALPAGVYLVRARGDTATAVRRVVTLGR